MANTYNFGGDDLSAWIKSSLQAYTYLSGTRQYVGKLTQQVTVTPNIDLVEWYDNVTGIQALYILDASKVDFSIAFSFMQVLDADSLAVALAGVLDKTDPNNNVVSFGSNPDAFQGARWDFVGVARTKRQMTLTIPNGVVAKPGAINLGTPGQFAMVPVTLRALIDTTQSDKRKNLAYFTIADNPSS